MYKKVLIITYYWPPYSGSGVQRWLKFSKYLPEFDYEPHIYTPENPHFNVRDEKLEKDIHPAVKIVKQNIWEPYSLADLFMGKKQSNKGLISGKDKGFKSKILNKIRANFFIPDPRKFWIKPSVKFLKNYIRQEGITQIISTGPPHSMHLIALGLKQWDKNLRWVADIRDPWSSFDFLQDYGASESSLKKHRKLESEVLNAADTVLATSYQMKDKLVNFDHNKFHCITNGFDKDDFESYNDESKKGKIRIYHAGLINQLRNPTALWQALARLCTENSIINENLEIHLAGTVDEKVINDISIFPQLADKLIVESYKSHVDVIKDYAMANILLLLVNNSDNASANIPGKLFEYLAVNKSILLVSEPGTDAERIVLQNADSYIMKYRELDSSQLNALSDFLLKSEDDKEALSEFALKYERKSLTKELVSLLEE